MDTQNIQENQWLIDVRSPDEYLQEHIPGSRNIPMDQIGTRIAELKNKPCILTCRSGRRAAEAKMFLEAQGCTNISLLEGGLQAWKSAGKPTSSLKKGYSVMQQVQMIAGGMVLIGSFIKPIWFLAPLAGAGLFIAGFTNTCLMASLLSKMPWNKIPPGKDPVGACSF